MGEHAMTVEAELFVPCATVQIATFKLAHPADDLFRERDAFWLDLCLTSRAENARVCFRDHWAPHRFERLGKLFALPPGETVHVRSDTRGSERTSLLCHLRPEAMGEWLDGELAWTDSQLLASLDVSSSRLCGLAQRVAEELLNPGFASATLIELMVAQLTIELARYWAKAEPSLAAGGLAPWRLRRIEERLREVASPPTLSELASLCGLSVRQLTRGYRASFRRSIGERLAEARLDQAKRLLAGDQSVKAIAHAVGFATPSAFVAAFGRATGQTPGAFRQRCYALKR